MCCCARRRSRKTRTFPPDLHLTARQAGEHATRAGAGQLVLTHLVPWYDRQRSLAEAAGSYCGPLSAATSGLVLGPEPPDRLSVMSRPDGRSVTELRPVKLTRGWLDHAEGSVLVEFGRTRVLCAASVAEEVPRWRRGSGQGWVTAEYAMLPRATNTRGDRESVRGRLGGRTQEISRLVGRSLRACVDYKALGENTIVIDCDVLQADGGTRTAAVTGGYVALADAVAWLTGTEADQGQPAAHLGGRGQRRPRRRRAPARPVLRGGRGGGHRHERGLHGQRATSWRSRAPRSASRSAVTCSASSSTSP